MKQRLNMRNESYHARKKRIQSALKELGINIGLANRITYRYPLNVVEKLVKETEKRQPTNPADYFLSGLKRSRITHKFNVYPKKRWRRIEKFLETHEKNR